MRWMDERGVGEILQFVMKNPHSSFYPKKYGDAGVLPKDISVEKFSLLPTLTRQELAGTPVGERIHVPRSQVRFAAFTSGTTSKQPLIIPFADVEDYYFEPSFGLPVSRPLVIHPPMMKSFGHTFIQQCRQAKQKMEVLFGDTQNLANSALLAAEFGSDTLYSIPTIAALFGSHARARGIADNFLLIALSSESLTTARRQELQSLFPRALIANLYGSTELGQLPFFPCPAMMEKGKNQFHILTRALSAVELVEGELVVTYGLNKATPLVRYKTGDYFEKVQEGCGCGLLGPVLAWSHRSSVDRVRINGVQFDVEEADRAFRRLKYEQTPDYQVHFRAGEGAAIIVHMEIADPELVGNPSRAKDCTDRLSRELPNEWRVSSGATVRTALDRGLFSKFLVEIVERVSSPGIKAKRFVNHFE